MKTMFQSKALHLAACILLFWKGISLLLCFLLRGADLLGEGAELLSCTGFLSAFALAVVGAFAESRIVTYGLLAVVCLVVLVYWEFFILLTINRSGAGVASVGLLILCGLDLPITAIFSFAQWGTAVVFLVFHIALFITVVLLRRSRRGAPTQVNEVPDPT